MKYKIKHWLLLTATILFGLTLSGCGDITTGNEELDQAIVDLVVDGVNSYLEDAVNDESAELPITTVTATPTPEPAIDENGWYYSKEDVALYIYTYDKLPENFIKIPHKNIPRHLRENRSSIGQREILAQSKVWKPQEYFVYFKVFNEQSCAERSARRAERNF